MADAAPASAQRRVLTPAVPPAGPRRIPFHVCDVLLPIAVALWAYGLSKTDVTSLGPLGLPAALPAAFYAGVGLLVLSALIELAVANSAPLRMGLHATALVIMLYGTAALVYPVGRYSWLYKTIGVVQYVNTNGKLDRTIDIYQNWPGFFALAGWFDRVAGVSSPLAYAKWAQVVFELAALPLLYLIYDGLALSYRQRWMALLLYPAANWIGQDYFSPQALGTVLSLGIMALTMRYLFTGNRGPGKPRRQRVRRLLRWITGQQPPAPPPPRRQAGGPVKRVKTAYQKTSSGIRTATTASFWRRLAAPGNARAQRQVRHAQADGHTGPFAAWGPDGQGRSLADRLAPAGRRSAFLVTILLLFFVLTAVHELSPYIVALQLVVLAAARPLLRPRWLPLAMVAIAIAYLLPRFAYVNKMYGILGSFGSFFGNAAPPSTSSSAYAGSIPADQLLIQHCADALSVLIWLLALYGAWRRRHSGRTVLSLLVLTFSPVLVLFGQAYGNEGLLRVYLFSLPWAAALAAAAVEPGPLARVVRPRIRATAARIGRTPRATFTRMREWDTRDAARLRRWALVLAAVQWGSVPQATARRLGAGPAAGWASVPRSAGRGLWAVITAVVAIVRAVHRAIRWFNATWFMAAVRWVRAPLTLCLVIGLFLVAFYGDDAFDAFSASEVNTVYSFLLNNKPGAFYVAEDNVPGDDTAEYYLWTSVVIFGARSGAPVVNKATPEIASIIAGNSLQYTDNGREPAYVVITPSMTPYNNAYKQAPDGSFEILEKSLAASKLWKLVVNHDGTVIYEYPPKANS